MKKVLMVQNLDGTKEAICKKCNCEMKLDSKGNMFSGRGELSDNIIDGFTCPNCGMSIWENEPEFDSELEQVFSDERNMVL